MLAGSWSPTGGDTVGDCPHKTTGERASTCALGSGSLDQLGSRVNLIEDDLEGLCSYQLC